METCMLLCFHVHITWKHTCFSVNVYMKAQKYACFHVLLQLVLTSDPTGKGSIGYGLRLQSYLAWNFALDILFPNSTATCRYSLSSW